MKSLCGTILAAAVAAVLAFAGTSVVAAQFDVAVVGGGPAGIGAAIASAKTGAKTVLVERD
ncbi:MAG: FAD-dependent oxidoreductase, partial [Kiritimatiellae bacterium]|nr:FAD-dependent oxidoreductase [Kiritimatiellia bacterium]